MPALLPAVTNAGEDEVAEMAIIAAAAADEESFMLCNCQCQIIAFAVVMMIRLLSIMIVTATRDVRCVLCCTSFIFERHKMENYS